MKKAFAAISFGTTYPAAREAILRMEQHLAAAFPTHDFFRAFTSGMVIEKIAREQGERIPNPAALLEALADAGYDEVLCQSLHVIPGLEYEKLLGQLAPYRARFSALGIGLPLLSEQGDYTAVVRTLLADTGTPAEGEALVYMGHGTPHFANAAYSQLETAFRAADAERVYVATVEGFPGLPYVLRRLARHGVRRVTLRPFMLVAGDHAQNDLAGEQDSWKTALEAAGYAVAVNLKPLGDYPAIAALFEQHARAAQELL